MIRSDVCAVVLAAGEGTRLRPITDHVPKPLCPIGNIALLDRVLARLGAHGLTGPASVAVNASYLADQIVSHVDGRAFTSLEPDGPLGTAGALSRLRNWIDGRPVLVANADAYLAAFDGASRDLGGLLDGWAAQDVRVLTVPAGDRPAEFGDDRFAGASLLPADLVAALPAGYSDLVHTIWRPAEGAGRLETVRYAGHYWDTGTPRDFLAANLHAAGEGSLVDASADVASTAILRRCVVGAGATVLGNITRTVVFPGAVVHAGEDLMDTIRFGSDVTLTAE